MAEINWGNVVRSIGALAIEFVRDEAKSAAQDMSELKQLGQRLGIPYVPGEDLNEYRKRVVAARDASKQ